MTWRGMRYESAEVADVQRYIDDPAWVLEQKLDGIRCIAAVGDDGTVRFTSHTGDTLKSGVRRHPAIAAVLTAIPGIVVDGELLPNGELWLFDVLQAVGCDVRLLPLQDRRGMLDLMQPVFGGSVVHVIPQARSATDKAALWAAVIDAGAEGVVAKRLTARYDTARRTKDVLKIKVTRTIDVVVVARNESASCSATLALHRDGQLVTVGKCSMIGKHPAQVGDVIEVTFLYIVDPAAPALYQARMMRPRPDKSAAECEWDQLDGCTVSKVVIDEVVYAS